MRVIAYIALFLMPLFAYGQNEVWMHPNVGQWQDPSDFKIDLQNGSGFIVEDGMSFVFTNWDRHSHEEQHEEEDILFHAVKTKFLGSNTQLNQKTDNRSEFYRNYFLGSDKSRWRSKVHSFKEVRYDRLYDGIDILYETSNDVLEYSFVIAPGNDPAVIKRQIEGQNDLFIDESGNLHILHSFGEIIESAPVAWTVHNGKRRAVPVQFKLNENILQFILPSNYPRSDTLIIDPVLTFSTFSGSTVDNWGFTATPDLNGNLFGAGVAMGTGYPVSAGVYDPTFNGGTIDVSISKFNTDGTTLLYSTYYGGSQSETPNSIVCSSTGELFVFGVTSSSNLPLGPNPYDGSYNGGPSLANNVTNNLGFTNGSDLYVARFSADGTSLLGATYIGGSGNDGCNISSLKFNYGDQFRGEIVLDAQDNVYVASMTQSGNFPVVQGSQGAISGSQDAVLFKMNSGLNNLLWSTFYGGFGLETGNAIEISSSGVVYVAGGTTSTDLPVTGGHDQSANGGAADGYVARFNGTNGTFLSGTYMGAGEYDQTFFVQLDLDDKVYVLGQSESDLGITSGVYGNANSGQFIRKYNNSLSTLEWTTVIGAGSGHVEISPTAFLVSDCYDIYLSGWGGAINSNPNTSQAVNSSSQGFPVTVDAYQPNTNGSNFYIAVLGQNAGLLKYGTYFGGVNSSYNHVDGGTSRFDKAGRIYHAVCGACTGNPTGFTTTPGVWSPVNQSSNCNMAAFKFELSTIEAIVSNPDPLVCLPDPVLFNNNSANGNAFYWDFGDGTFSNDVNPSHVYPGPGVYDVTLVVSDTNGCFTSDSVVFQVNIGEFSGGVVPLPGPICPGDTIQLEAFGGNSYAWSPGQYLDDATSATPMASVEQTTEFQVIVSDSCGTDTLSILVEVFSGSIQASNDTSICIGNSVPLFANGGVSTVWSPSIYLDDPNTPTPVSTPLDDIMYTVEILTASGCILRDSVFIDVFFQLPIPVLPDTLFVCQGESVVVTAQGGETYFWYPDNDIDNVNSPVVSINSPISQYFYCDLGNSCGVVTDSVWLELVVANIEAFSDTILCPGNSVDLRAEGGVSYYWWPSYGLSAVNISQVTAMPLTPIQYYVIGYDVYGCAGSDSVLVDLYPQALILTNPDVYAFVGDNVQLSATTTTPGSITWYPTEYLSCVVCPNPVANPDEEYFYIASYTDANGCSASDTVHIYYDPILYVPNTFTPNEDSDNQLFRVVGGNITAFRMDIYNRWGELIHTMEDISGFWDGTYNDADCQDGTYTWKIVLRDLRDEEHIYVGHVNLIR